VIGLCLTAWTGVMVSDAQDAQVRATFVRDIDKVTSDTNVRLQTYFDMLLSLKGMFAVNDHVDRAAFARYVQELNLTQRYPGFQAIQFVRAVPDDQLAAFTAQVRQDTALVPGGYPDFTVHPPYPGPEHFVIEYNRPMKGNESAFGLDLAALPPHRQAIELGRDTGAVVATARIVLVQDKTGRPGFVARAPVYRIGAPLDTVAERRAALVGLVAIVFRVENLMREVIDPSLGNHLAFRIHDGGPTGRDAPTPDNLMFDSIGDGRHSIARLHTRTQLPVAGRTWNIEFEAREGSRYSRDPTAVAVIGAGGVIISALIAALLMASNRSRLLAERLRGALDDQRAFQDSASVGIALFSSGVIVRCNRGMEELMGYGPDELTGQPTRVLAGAGAADPFEAPREGRRWQGEMQLTRKDGTVIWCLVHGKALHGVPLERSGVWVIQDVTDRKSTEAALLDARHGLEHSVAELDQQKAAVQAAQHDLAAVLSTLKQAQTNLITSEKMASLGFLVAGIAHELNTPIGNSLLTASALADMVHGFEQRYAEGGIRRSELEAHLRETRTACDIMTTSLRRAADLINSFKQVAVDQTSDKRRTFDLHDVVKDTFATYAAQLRRANCETHVDVPTGLELDSYPGSVGQVLSNLINNTLLHAFEGRSHGVIAMSARALDGDVEFVFADDGVGMPPKVLHQVFDPFFTTKMGQGGSGLGMNIVYNIVTNILGGHIDIASDPGQGTRITVRLPKMAPKRDVREADLALLLS
jgi:PAS domain S-box-containing protein